MRRSENTPELLDGPLEPAQLAGNLRDLERVNRLLGGSLLSWRALDHLLGMRPAARASASLLDVGTGAADIALALVERARRAGLELDVLATDVRDEIVSLARRRTAAEPRVAVVLAPADRLDQPDGSFDVVHASLVLHHLDAPAASRLLAEMARVCRYGVIVNDLARGRHWWLAAWLLSRLVTLNRYTRHDAPLSVRRAYTPAELVSLAAGAGLHETARFSGPLGHRYALVFVKR